MLADSDRDLIFDVMSKELEARSAAARVAYEVLVNALLVVAQTDLRPSVIQALSSAAQAVRLMSDDEDDAHQLMAEEIEAYAVLLEVTGAPPDLEGKSLETSARLTS